MKILGLLFLFLPVWLFITFALYFYLEKKKKETSDDDYKAMTFLAVIMTLTIYGIYFLIQ